MDELLTRELLDDLAEIVAIPSVYGTPEEDAPYGKECRRALEWFVNKAHQYGLRAELIDGACAYAEAGTGAECVGILGHLDVVPAGNGWASDPFKMTEENGKVYGRGVGDDKGAVVVCLHALKALKEKNVPLKRRVRLIVGADEERGSSCIRHYLETGGEVPVMSFVPDSEFPVINSEKGIAHIVLEFADKEFAANVSDISGAECANAVPDRAEVKIKKGSPLYAAIADACGGSVTADLFKTKKVAERIVTDGNSFSDYELHNTSDGITVVANGTAEHASTPEKGDNALWKVLGFLSVWNDVVGSKYADRIYEYLCTPLASTKLGIYADDEKSGDTTMCLSQARLNGGLELLIDFRLPLGLTADAVAKSLEEHLGCRAVVRDYHENLYIPEDAPLIKALLKVYRALTGDMTAPLKTGGGTYARELPNAVAFGCTPVDIDINMHRADENFPVEQLFKNYEIYYAAARELANM